MHRFSIHHSSPTGVPTGRSYHSHGFVLRAVVRNAPNPAPGLDYECLARVRAAAVALLSGTW
jgi:hypothetical protein